MSNINIISASKELNKIERYQLTMSKDSCSVKDIPDGTAFKVVAFCVFTEVKKEGDTPKEIFSMLTDEGKVYGTQSNTFRRSFGDIAALFEDGEPVPVIKLSGKTKAGRDYVDCALDLKAV